MTGRTDEELNWFLARMRAIVEQTQDAWRDSELEPERWFSRLRITSADIDQDKATFLLADDTDGRRYAYRWWLWDEEGEDALADPEEALSLFSTHLLEDVDGCLLKEGLTYRASSPDRNQVQWIGDNRPDPNPELGNLKLRFRDIIYNYMIAWKDSQNEPQRRFSQLRLTSANIDENAVTLILDDRKGQRHGYRWPIRDDITADCDRAVSLFDTQLREDVQRLGHSEPDPDGIRWFSEERPPLLPL